MHIDFSFKFIFLLIFFMRICDVTLGTMRIIFVARGYKLIAAICGFFEILIWISALGFVVTNLSSVLAYIFYALGFSCGVYIGMFIEEKLAIGVLLMEVIISEKTDEFVKELKNHNYDATIIPAKGLFNPVDIIYILFERTKLNEIVGILNCVNPNAFYSLQDIRSNNKNICAIPKFRFIK